MTVKELTKINEQWFMQHNEYQMLHYTMFNYALLKRIMYSYQRGRGSENSINNAWIMLDTETSKERQNPVDPKGRVIPVQNYVCAWTISIRAYHQNIATLYGSRPSEAVACVSQIANSMRGFETVLYVHNLAYDWTFLRKFCFTEWGHPESQLNVKSHYPIYIKWDNGITFKDSYILAQRSLEKWATDLNVEHKKAVGAWDYEKIRDQSGNFSADELRYIECDTLAGVECLDTLAGQLNKCIYSIPYTATGIPREHVRKLASENKFREQFKRMAPTYEQYCKLLKVYHGGYTHANRHIVNYTIRDIVKCLDFASSYPFCLLAYKFPMEKFTPMRNCEVSDILTCSESYAFMFKLVLDNVRLKDDDIPMPALQYSKAVKTVNAVLDNGRILCADYVEIYLTEVDLEAIDNQYIWDSAICCEVEFSAKEYLPRWFTDYVYECFINKTKLKGGDPVAYALAKALINSLYGMLVQRSIRDTIMEDYLTGEYTHLPQDEEQLYQKYLDSRTSVLPYQWGVWVTAYAQRNLFRLGSCCDEWLYSDTDSCYSATWNMDKVEAYNNDCKRLLIAQGYTAVEHDGREYWLGVAEVDGIYSEFKTQGAKRYAVRYADVPENAEGKRGKLAITVAGVPKKKGALALNDDITNFKTGFVFPGTITGKKEHTYFTVDSIYDKNNIEYGDSIDLTPCDYTLDCIELVDWFALFYDDIEVQVYEDN